MMLEGGHCYVVCLDRWSERSEHHLVFEQQCSLQGVVYGWLLTIFSEAPIDGVGSALLCAEGAC
jgi:hypothetical protein